MRAAVIGTGQIARQHLACLREIPEVEIVGVCDLSPSVAEAVADRFSVPSWFTNHRSMLHAVKPDVVHVTTPPAAHFALAKDAIDAGAHVIVEKPITTRYEDTLELLQAARSQKRILIEDYNYLFNSQVQRIMQLVDSGAFGQIVHLEGMISLQIGAPDSPFVDPNVPHPLSAMTGGAIADFLPHLASLAHLFLGEHRAVRTIWRKHGDNPVLLADEFRALVDAEHGAAVLGFSARAQPETFLLQVHGTRMRAAANLFETRLTVERVRGVPNPLLPLLNGLEEARQMRRGAYSSLWRKLGGGPGAYEGLWELLRRTYRAVEAGSEPPVSPSAVRAVNRLVRDLTQQEYRL